MDSPQEQPPTGVTTLVQQSLARLWDGSESARQDLFRFAYERLLSLVRAKLNDFPRLRDWEQSDDVLQRVATRLHQSLDEVKPKTTREFFGLAALQIRRVLLDLARKVDASLEAGPTMATGTSILRAGLPQPSAGEKDNPANQAEWLELHAAVQSLPPELREVVDLLYYSGLSQEEAAATLDVSVRTVKRRWREARLMLHEKLAAMKFGQG